MKTSMPADQETIAPPDEGLAQVIIERKLERESDMPLANRVTQFGLSADAALNLVTAVVASVGERSP